MSKEIPTIINKELTMKRAGLSTIAVVGCLLVVTSTGEAGSEKKAGHAEEFAGSESCRTCHAEEYESWKESWHSKIIRPKKGAILKEAVEKWGGDGTNPGPTTGNVSGKTYTFDDVQYVVGSRWKQRYLVKNEQSGGLQFLNMQFNRASLMWEKYGQKNDWDSMCATCHTTGYRILEYDEKAGRTVKSDFVEMGVGCEACHGPGARHVESKKEMDIFNPARLDVQAQSKVCGYCHIRLENERWKSAQGNPREDFPAPKVGETHRPGDDWTTWYPEEVIIPGVQEQHPFDAEYQGDLKGMFKVDEISKASGVYEEAKHHQEYQGFIQSAHYQKAKMSCITCHSPHAGKGKIKKVSKDACGSCHDATFTVEAYMPNTGKTADNLFVRSHTFVKSPRKGGPGAAELGTPHYYE
ncbi:MAG: multiheme c-type cytochrome [Thermodesulfobacteriota bacterium]